MRVDVLTLFPGMFAALDESILGKAREKGIVRVNIVNIRDYATDKHRVTDDTPYGGGTGMIMKPEPICAALEDLSAEGARVILTCPQGKTFTQKDAWFLSGEDRLVFICGRYEGVDERVREYVTDEYSIGDYVLTGGEIPAMVMIDAVVRLLPGVLGGENAPAEDSFSTGLLEGPQYTRPYDFRGRKVPDILLSGDHGRIRKWRRFQALKRTYERRPDLLREVELTPEDRQLLERIEQGLPFEG